MDDYGKPGTATHRRMWDLKGISQKRIGELCRPKMKQGAVSQFELGTHRMNWKLAERMAPAYFPELSESNPHHAQLSVWRLWFANVEAYGSDVMKRFAAGIRKTVERDVFTIEEELPLFASTRSARAETASRPLRLEDLGELSDSEESMIAGVGAQLLSGKRDSERRNAKARQA